MLYTASFYDPDHWVGQSYRVSRAHPRGMRTQWEAMPFLYPPRELLRAYQSGAVDFKALAAAYQRELDALHQQSGEFREWVDGLAASGDVTLLCFEQGDKACHRRVAAQWLLRRTPELGCGDLR